MSTIPPESTERTSIHGLWSSKVAFILAATGSAVGLGNIWKFPYTAGENGGGLFVLIYLGCILVIGIPILMAEVMLGRRGRRNPVETMRLLAQEAGQSQAWVWVGRMGIIAGFLILSYYSVVAGWILAYVFRMASGVFQGLNAEQVQAVFDNFVSDPERLIAWHTIFIVLSVAIVARGVEHGLEKAVKYLMPALFGILLILLLYATTTPTFIEGVRFMFVPDFSKIDGYSGFFSIVLNAMGMAFFSLSLGMGAIMIYGSYLPKDASIGNTSITVAMADTSVALIAGLAIFPIVLANGMAPSQGAGLVFNSLPIAFDQMPFGGFFGTLFFVLLAFAAITSAISLLEPPVAWLVESKGFDRAKAAVFSGAITWFIGLGTVFSFNLWSDYKWTLLIDLDKVQYVLFKDKTFFDIVDFLTTNIMLPLGGLMIALFVGHAMRRDDCFKELALKENMFNSWYFILRNISPIAVGFVFLNVIGVFKLIGLL